MPHAAGRRRGRWTPDGARLTRWMPYAIAGFLVVAGLLRTSPAAAHVVGLSQSEFVVEDGVLRAMLVFSKIDAVALGDMDPDGDGYLSPEEVSRAESILRERVAEGILVRAGGAPCAAALEHGEDTERDGFLLLVSFDCPVTRGRVEVELRILDRLGTGHRHALQLSDGRSSVQAMLSRAERFAVLELSGDGADAPAHPATPAGPGATAAVTMGIEHILTGWDHVLFLAVLLLGAKGFKDVALAVSAFTVSHSAALALAAFGVYAPGPNWVEPAIAASIAFVAFGNVAGWGARHARWPLTFAFGLVHGFGFAGALQELALAHDRLLPTLLAFNLGVEMGQLAVVAVAFPLLVRLRRRATFERTWARWASMAAGLIGVVLCGARLLVR